MDRMERRIANRWEEMPGIVAMVERFGAEHACPGQVIKPEEGQSLARALGEHSMVLMRRHGATVVGSTLQQLVFRTIYSHANAT